MENKIKQNQKQQIQCQKTLFLNRLSHRSTKDPIALRTSKDPAMSKVWLDDMARRDAGLATARRSTLALVE